MQSLLQNTNTLTNTTVNTLSGLLNSAKDVLGLPSNISSHEVTKADILQAEEAERARREAKDIKVNALANAKAVSNIIKAAQFPRPTSSQGFKRYTRSIQEQERGRQMKNQDEISARKNISSSVARLITSHRALTTPQAPVNNVDAVEILPMATKRSIDQTLDRIEKLITRPQKLAEVKRAEEEERERRTLDSQGQYLAQQNASRVSLDVEGHMMDAETREEAERERRMNNSSEVALSRAWEVAQLIEERRAETNLRATEVPAVNFADDNQAEMSHVDQEIMARKARAKIVSDMILEARRAFELSRTAAPSHTSELLHYAPTSSVPVVPATSLTFTPTMVAPVPTMVATVVRNTVSPVAPTVIAPVVSAATAPAAPVVSVPSDPNPKVKVSPSVSFAPPAFTRSYSTAGSMSPTIFPLRRSNPVPSTDMRSSGEHYEKPRVVIVPDSRKPLAFVDSPTALSRSVSSSSFATPQSFAAHPLSRSLSSHELSFMKKTATKHEKISLKQAKKAEKYLHQAEKLKAKGKFDQSKKKENAALELRKDALKHEETANRNKFGAVTPAM